VVVVVAADVPEGRTTTHVHVTVAGDVGQAVGPLLPVQVEVTVWPVHLVLAGHVVRVVVVVLVLVMVSGGGVVGQLHGYLLVVVLSSHASHLV
jgi:hypothetical protein